MKKTFGRPGYGPLQFEPGKALALPNGEIFNFAKVPEKLALHDHIAADLWLFVNIQYPGETFAITGPWQKGWL